MNLVSVYDVARAPDILWQLLSERPEDSRISHLVMPSREEHDDFLTSTPYRYWYLIDVDTAFVGDVCVTDLNEIGVHVLKAYQRNGYASAAVQLFIQNHDPLPAIPAKRNPRWLANIAVRNDGSKAMFTKLGFGPLQETWIK